MFIQIKPQLASTTYPSEWLKVRRLLNIGEFVEQLELSYILVGADQL